MFFIAGISAKIKPAGRLPGLHCPACGRTADLPVVHKYLTPHLFFIPTFPFQSTYLATCPFCASVMALDRELGHALRRHGAAEVAEADLTLLQNNNRPRCKSCGAILGGAEHFCPSCGHSIRQD